MFSKESLVFVGSIELPYIPRQRHHSYIILRELETSGKVLFHPKSFCDSSSLIISPMVLVGPPSSPWVITGQCFQISPLWAPAFCLPSSGAPTRSPSRATETPRQPREDDCLSPARRCWSNSSTEPPLSPWSVLPGTDAYIPPLPRVSSTRLGPSPGDRGTSVTAGQTASPFLPGQTTTDEGERSFPFNKLDLRSWCWCSIKAIIVGPKL